MVRSRLAVGRIAKILAGTIVNLAWVGEVQPRFKDAAPTELPVARERARAFKERLVP